MEGKVVFPDINVLVKFVLNDLDKYKREKTPLRLQKTLYFLFAFYGATYGQLRKEKEEEAIYKTKYKEMTEVLEERLSDIYKYEYKKPSIFSKEEEKTGRIIIDPDEFDKIKEQARLGRVMNSRYEFLASGEVNKENHRLNSENVSLRSENEELKQTNKQFEKICTGACKVIKNHFGDKVYHTGLKFLDDKVGKKGKSLFRRVTTIDDKDKAMFEEKDRQKRTTHKPTEHVYEIKHRHMYKDNKNKDEGFDLEK